MALHPKNAHSGTVAAGKDTPGHEYPSSYHPGVDPLLDEIWESLDRIRPGVLSLDVRAYIAGCWRGHVMRHIIKNSTELLRALEKPQ